METIPNLLKSLGASRNKQSTLQNLSNLRSIVKHKSQFTIVYKCGGLRTVVNCLLQKHSSIVDNALSLLANCCSDRDCAKEVVRCNGIRILNDILKHWSQDTIICRTCRTIGNIAQFDSYSTDFYNVGIVAIIVTILNKSTDPKNKQISMGTQDMAVRVLRILWQSYSLRPNMVQDGVIRAVSLVLIEKTEKWKTDTVSESHKKQIRNLLENILKCMLLFTKIGNLECVQQLLADGNGFKSLVTLIEINPYASVKCLTNLSHAATSRQDVANAEAVRSIIMKLKQHLQKIPIERCPTDLINAFCLFCKHPLNCSEVKKAGGLQLILEILKNCKSRRQEYQIVNALSGFHHDEQSQEMLVSCGVVQIIITCLERNLKSREDLNAEHTYVKRSKRTKRTKYQNNYGIRRMRREHSPDTTTNSSSLMHYLNDPMFMNSGRMTPPDSDSTSSPNCTPPRPRDNNDSDDDDSVNYSPICSDVEQDIEDAATMQSIIIESDSSDIEDEQTHFESSDFQERAIIMMLIVLSRVAHMKPNAPEMSLAAKDTFIILIKYLRESKHPSGRILILLTKIVSNPDNFVQLVLSESILLIHSLTEMQHGSDCSTCYRMDSAGQSLMKHICTLVESDPCKGQLYYIMQKGNNEHKRKCIISVPFIVKIRAILVKFMDTWSGLNTLITLFIENVSYRFQISIALYQLACSIQINSPVLDDIPRCICNLSATYEFKPSSTTTTTTNLITIRLDDESTVTTDKDFLIEKVEYFRMMLTGSFKESNQQVIRLRNVSNRGLKCLLNLLQYDYHHNKMPQQLNHIELVTVLELIVLTDIYLLKDLTVWLTNCVEQYSLKVESACDIYCWSIASRTNLLRIETVAFILTATIKDTQRYHLIQTIIDSGLLDQITQDIQNLISRYLIIT